MVLLEVKNLTKRFGGLTAVDDLEFSVNEGEILGLIGPNGAGKSTVFNLITSFLTPTRGIVLFKNKKITHLNTHKIASIGVVRTFQNNNLFLDMSVYENIMISQHLLGSAGSWGYFLNTVQARLDEKEFHETSMELLGFTGLMVFKDELAKNLSHGHQRILWMALALAVKPKLLLLEIRFRSPAIDVNRAKPPVHKRKRHRDLPIDVMSLDEGVSSSSLVTRCNVVDDRWLPFRDDLVGA